MVTASADDAALKHSVVIGQIVKQVATQQWPMLCVHDARLFVSFARG